MFVQIVLATLAGLVIGTPRGEALRWRPGRHWFGRLVVTSRYTLCDGTPLYMWSSGKPPLSVEHVQVRV